MISWIQIGSSPGKRMRSCKVSSDVYCLALMEKRHLKYILRLVMFVALYTAVAAVFSGCVTVPENALVIRGSNDQALDRYTSTCESFNGRQQTGGVDPDGFTVLSWNSHKGGHPGWSAELHTLGEKADFILLQEAALDAGLKEQMGLLGKEWLLAVAFVYDEEDIGILSAGRTPPQAYCVIREYESVIKIPKIILASTYPIEGFESELLIINLHMVNFTIGSDAVRRQVKAAREKIKSHQGPVIVAGDFNTWNAERESVVQEEMIGLGLQAVSFSPDNRVEFFGRVVDGIYYKGLEVTSAKTSRVKTSDHNPLEVAFRLKQGGQI
jgi:endonuclease/exonuclease/phosphatase (EEP) superfamily protein YafD